MNCICCCCSCTCCLQGPRGPRGFKGEKGDTGSQGFGVTGPTGSGANIQLTFESATGPSGPAQSSATINNNDTVRFWGNSMNFVVTQGSAIIQTEYKYTDFVFIPGYSGNTFRLYNDWNNLYIDFIKIEGPKRIFIDGSLNGGSVTIPSGNYDMRNTSIYKTNNIIPHVSLNISDGVTLNGLERISGIININNMSSSGPVITLSMQSFELHEGVFVSNPGSSPFISAVSGFNAIVINGSQIDYNTNSPVQVLSPATCVFTIDSGGRLGDDAVSGDGNINLFLVSSGAQINLPYVSSFFTGSISYSRFNNFIKFNNKSVDPTVNDDTNQGFRTGDQWLNSVSSNVFVCVDDTVGSAIWKMFLFF